MTRATLAQQNAQITDQTLNRDAFKKEVKGIIGKFFSLLLGSLIDLIYELAKRKVTEGLQAKDDQLIADRVIQVEDVDWHPDTQ